MIITLIRRAMLLVIAIVIQDPNFQVNTKMHQKKIKRMNLTPLLKTKKGLSSLRQRKCLED